MFVRDARLSARLSFRAIAKELWSQSVVISSERQKAATRKPPSKPGRVFKQQSSQLNVLSSERRRATEYNKCHFERAHGCATRNPLVNASGEASSIIH